VTIEVAAICNGGRGSGGSWRNDSTDFAGRVRWGEVLPIDYARIRAGVVAEIDVGVDATVDDGDADAAAIEAEVMGGVGVDGGDGVLGGGGECAIRRDVFDAGVAGEGGERGAGEAGREAVDGAEFGDGPLASGRGAGARPPGRGAGVSSSWMMTSMVSPAGRPARSGESFSVWATRTRAEVSKRSGAKRDRVKRSIGVDLVVSSVRYD